MKNYEIMFLIKPDLDEKSIKDQAESMKKIFVDAKAKDVEMKEMGQRELAYEIKDYKTAYYFLLNFKAENSEAVDEFNRVALINENLIRHLILNKED